MKGKVLAIATLCAATSLAPATARAWGQNGHRVVGAIAEQHLGEAARTRAREILGGLPLAQVSTWADEIRSDASWDCAKPFHYVTAPAGEPFPGERAVAKGNALQAVVYYTDVLTAPRTSPAERNLALRLLVHFVADLHQPLHAGLGCDLGGNRTPVLWFGEQTNLHNVWDEKLIESQGLSYTELAAFIEEAADGGAQRGEDATPLDWIAESQAYLASAYTCVTARRGDHCPCYCGACEDGLSTFGGCGLSSCNADLAGAHTPAHTPPRLRYDYRTRNTPIVRARLRDGGLRLAALLEWALAADPAPPPRTRAVFAQVRALSGWDDAARQCRGNTTP